jgi:hypothetical protein
MQGSSIASDDACSTVQQRHQFTKAAAVDVWSGVSARVK